MCHSERAQDEFVAVESDLGVWKPFLFALQFNVNVH